MRSALRFPRRRRRLNAALHELRRPLQSLTLLIESRLPPDDDVRACAAALQSALSAMDDAVNGVRRPLGRVRFQAAELLAGVEVRWQSVAPVSCRAEDSALIGRPALVGDPAALGRALDNLVANAIEHGSSPVEVALRTDSDRILFEVRDGGAAASHRRGRKPDPRRGHGLEIAAAIAESHGGVAIPPRFETAGTTAALMLPVALPRTGT